MRDLPLVTGILERALARAEEAEAKVADLTRALDESASASMKLTAEYGRMLLRAEAAEKALRFYAESEWCDGYPGGVRVDDNTLDFGAVARAALSKEKEGA